MQVYIAPEVAEIISLHPYLYDEAFRSLPIRDQISKQAATVHEAHEKGDERTLMHIMSWWLQAHGKTREELLSDDTFTLDEARNTMAREYGYHGWEPVSALGDARTNSDFELALDDVLAGEEQKLEDRLKRNPNLARERSAYGHSAALLHYLGANGVESHRQRTPMNAVRLARLLIEYGADPAAEADMYGGGQTPFALASTSAHPHKAGISEELNEVLSVHR